MSEHNMKLAATLSAGLNPLSPVIMGGDPFEKISRAASLGYDGIELHWASPDDIPIQEITLACEQKNLSISAFATGRAYVQEGLCLIHEEEENRNAAIKRLLRFVDVASPFGAPVIIGCIRGNIPAGKPQTSYVERLADSIHLIASYAEKQGVPIVLEAINRYENNYLNTARQTADFILQYQLPNTKILLDTFHMNIEETSLPDAITSCGNLLGYVHIADSNRHFAGAGHIPFESIIAALKDIGYQGYLSGECLPLPDWEPALRGWIVNMLEILKGSAV